MAAHLLGLLREAPADRAQLQELMRFFHSLAGVGTSFGFPQVTALAKEGELECLAILHDKAALSPTEIENWTRLVGALAHELSQPPTTSTGSGRAGMVTRLPEVLLVSPDSAVAATLAPLIEQEGHAARPLATKAEATQALGQALPDALIVDAALDDGSGYDVIDQPPRDAGRRSGARPRPGPARRRSWTRWRPSTGARTGTSRSRSTGRRSCAACSTSWTRTRPMPRGSSPWRTTPSRPRT